MNIELIGKIAGSLGSLITFGFGCWHFFVPKAWNWYTYFDPQATELIPAVRATNFFFSLSLILFGGLGILFLWHTKVDPFSQRALLGVLVLLWGARVVMQLIFPQGSLSATLQYGMLAAFLLTFGLFLFSFLTVR